MIRGNYIFQSLIGITYCSVAYWILYAIIIAAFIRLTVYLSDDQIFGLWNH